MSKKTIIVNFIIQKLKSKQTSLKKYTNWAKLIYFSLVLREPEEKKPNISHLSAAYHPNSMFSMCAVYPAGTTAHGGSKLTHYQVDSRNLNLIIQPNKRMNFLKLGNANVIKFLNDMPKTKHDLNSFTLGKQRKNCTRGHSISTWTRWVGGGGYKMSVFVHAQGIKTVHARGGGSKIGKILST